MPARTFPLSSSRLESVSPPALDSALVAPEDQGLIPHPLDHPDCRVLSRRRYGADPSPLGLGTEGAGALLPHEGLAIAPLLGAGLFPVLEPFQVSLCWGSSPA